MSMILTGILTMIKLTITAYRDDVKIRIDSELPSLGEAALVLYQLEQTKRALLQSNSIVWNGAGYEEKSHYRDQRR